MVLLKWASFPPHNWADRGLHEIRETHALGLAQETIQLGSQESS
jgi:hypothetical protein